MKSCKILFIAPSSYPLWGAEANVNAKVVRALTQAGCIVDLVSRNSKAQYQIYPPSKGDFFFGQLNSVEVVKTKTQLNLRTVFRHLTVYLKTGYVYRGCDWAIDAIRVCEKKIKNTSYDFVYTYDYPSEIVGAYLARKYHIKWIGTWNDPYILEKYPYPYGTGAQTKVSYFRRKLIRHIGKFTYRNIFPSARLRDYMLGYMENMPKDRCVVIPHFFPKEWHEEGKNNQGSVLKVIHAGVFGKERNPEIFFQALKMFSEQVKEPKIEFTFLGIFEKGRGNRFEDLIKRYGIESYVKFLPAVSYQESLNIIKQYDVCMIIEAPCREGIFLPSKVVDYLQNNKSVLTLSPKVGVLHDMYQEKFIDYFADVSDVQSIVAELKKLYYDFETDNLGNKYKDIFYYTDTNISSLHADKIWS